MKSARGRSAISLLPAIVLVLFSTVQCFAETDEAAVTYGADISFPMHHEKVSNNYAWLPHNVDPENNPTPPQYEGMPIQHFADRQKWYDDLIAGCVKHYGRQGHLCKSTERDRVAMSLRQPHSMQNYTDNGFKKIKTPPAVWKLIQDFWEKNKDNQKPENWFKGNTYTNHWDAPTSMVSVEDTSLRGGGSRLKGAIWDAAKNTIQEWTDQELTQCSLYGIRVYTEGAVLATHVDRLPLVSSAIVNVAQDVDEPWPIEVIGHDGLAHNITMEPGDMVLYESHSILHGRPFPLKGRYYANLFIHFEPTGHSLRHHEEHFEDGKDVHEKYKEAVARRAGGHEADHDGLPDYIKMGSDEEKKWHQRHPDNKRSAKMKSFTTGSTSAHQAAQSGDVKELKELVSRKGVNVEKIVNAKDENGWTPLHEGARGGHKEVVELLVNNGATINDRTGDGDGATALWYAEDTHGKHHPVVKFLKKIGALSIGPEL